jgi:predicted alpha/beta hydrolase
MTTAQARTGLPAQQSALPQPFALIADDGRQLAASWIEPQGEVRAMAVIHSATGVPRGYYRAFAEWLAWRGYAVLTYDYRGVGDSRRGPVRLEPASMQDWAVRDMSAAIAAAQARGAAQGLPLLLVGHSFGGNSLAFARGVERADAILLVAAQIPTFRHFPGMRRWVTAFFFKAWVPALVKAFGHLPAWANGGGESLPRQVARQWCDWGCRDAWAFSDPAMHRFRSASAVTAPVHLWNVSDDLTYAPPRAVDALAAQFRNAVVQRHEIRPGDVQQRVLGHFGAFRRATGGRLWSRLLAPIEAAAPRLARLSACGHFDAEQPS